MIFNINNNGTAEFKRAIGFLYKSVDFEKFLPFVEIVKNYLLQYIGNEIYTLAEDHYNSENYLNEEFKELNSLVNLIQDAIARGSYRLYVPSGDITHSNKGRQIFVSDQEKPAFEWQINKDNQNLIKIEGIAIDTLLSFLDNCQLTPAPDPEADPPQTPPTPSVGDVWHLSESFKKSKSLFINTTLEFNTHIDIKNSRRLFMLLIPHIARAERNIILPVIGQTWYSEIKSMILNGTIEDEGNENHAEMLLLIQQCLPFYAMSKAILQLSMEVLPEGLMINYITSTQNSANAATDEQRQQYSATMKSAGEDEIQALYLFKNKMDPPLIPIEENNEHENHHNKKPFFNAI